MIANPLRGEVVLVMDDQEHVLRLNLAALMQLEQMLGEDSLVSMVQRFENNAYTSRDVMRVLLAGLWGGRMARTRRNIGTGRHSGRRCCRRTGRRAVTGARL